MTIERIKIESREQWLALRKFDVTASQGAAIWDLHPFLTHARLYYEKQGIIEFDPISESGPMRRGRMLEPAVGAGVAEQRPDWRIEKCGDYYRDVELSLGGTPDFLIHNDPRGLGCLQTKTTNFQTFEREWADGVPPIWITTQNLIECMLTGAAFGAIAVMVVDQFDAELHIIGVERHAAAEQKIRDGVAQFWLDIEQGREPGIDFERDRELLKVLLPKEDPGVTVDLTSSNEVVSGLRERAELKERIKLDLARCEAVETMIMAKMQEAERAIVPGFSVSWKTQQRKGYIVEPSSPRVLMIREKKPA